jgi:hypothetical protein
LHTQDWLRDAEPIRHRGTRSARTELNVFYTDLARFIAVEMADEQSGGPGDKFERARALLRNGFAENPDPQRTNSVLGIKKSYERFTKHFQSSYYFSPTLILNWLRNGVGVKKRPLAPTVYALLSDSKPVPRA